MQLKFHPEEIVDKAIIELRGISCRDGLSFFFLYGFSFLE